MRCAKREPGRSWEAIDSELKKLGVPSQHAPIPSCLRTRASPASHGLINRLCIDCLCPADWCMQISALTGMGACLCRRISVDVATADDAAGPGQGILRACGAAHAQQRQQARRRRPQGPGMPSHLLDFPGLLKCSIPPR